jgi:hypothetical protein
MTVVSDEVVVPASRTKTLVLLICAIGFVALGCWFLSLDPKTIEAQHRYSNPLVVYGLGWVTVAFFGFATVAAVWRMFSAKPGLVLNNEGVRIFAIGQDTFLPWSDVSGLSIFEVRRTRLLVVKLTNPDAYLESRGTLRRALGKASLKLCGSPIAVAPNTVALSFDELRQLFARYISQYGNAA